MLARLPRFLPELTVGGWPGGGIAVLPGVPAATPETAIVSVTQDIATLNSAYTWPVDSALDFLAGSGTVTVVDNIATFETGGDTCSWPVSGFPADDGPGVFEFTFADGFVTFTPDAVSYSFPVTTL